MSILHNIVDLMQKKGMGNKDLAEKLGLTAQAVTDWKAGRSKSYNKYLPQIADILDVSIDYLLDKKEKPTGVSADELDEALKKVSEIASTLSDEEKQKWIDFGEMIIRSRKQ